MKLRLRELRIDHDLSQRELSEYLICDQSLYSKYERNQREVPIRILVMLADYYNTSVDYLVGRTDVKHPYEPTHEE